MIKSLNTCLQILVSFIFTFSGKFPLNSLADWCFQHKKHKEINYSPPRYLESHTGIGIFYVPSWSGTNFFLIPNNSSFFQKENCCHCYFLKLLKQLKNDLWILLTMLLDFLHHFILSLQLHIIVHLAISLHSNPRLEFLYIFSHHLKVACIINICNWWLRWLIIKKSKLFVQKGNSSVWDNFDFDGVLHYLPDF